MGFSNSLELLTKVARGRQGYNRINGIQWLHTRILAFRSIENLEYGSLLQTGAIGVLAPTFF